MWYISIISLTVYNKIIEKLALKIDCWESVEHINVVSQI